MMPITKEGELAASIIAYIKKNIIPGLPQVSETYVEHFGGKFDNAKVLSASFLCQCMRAFYLEIEQKENLNYMQVFALRAFLAETLKAGNCIEFALVAAMKLLDCPGIKRVMRVGDLSANDHAYVRLLDEAGDAWIYDPWLDREQLFTEEGHCSKMKELGLIKVEPNLIMDTVLPLSYGRDYSEALDSSFDEEDLDPTSPKALFHKYQSDFRGIVKQNMISMDAFVVRKHLKCPVSEQECRQAQALTDDILSRCAL